MQPVRGIEQGGGAQHRNQSPGGALVSPRVPTARNVYRGCCRFDPYEESKEHGRPQAAKKSPVGSFLVFGSHPVGMSNVVAAAAFARGIFNLTRTGIEQHGPAQQGKQSAQWAVA